MYTLFNDNVTATRLLKKAAFVAVLRSRLAHFIILLVSSGKRRIARNASQFFKGYGTILFTLCYDWQKLKMIVGEYCPRTELPRPRYTRLHTPQIQSSHLRGRTTIITKSNLPWLLKLGR